jgi:hypothetical protein
MDTSPELIVTHPECLLILFSLDEPGGWESLNQQRAAWSQHASEEDLDKNHVALVLRPGWVGEPGR